MHRVLYSKVLCCYASPQTDRVFSDILMCQAEPTKGVVNVKDMYLSGNSTTPMFDSSVVSKN